MPRLDDAAAARRQSPTGRLERAVGGLLRHGDGGRARENGGDGGGGRPHRLRRPARPHRDPAPPPGAPAPGPGSAAGLCLENADETATDARELTRDTRFEDITVRPPRAGRRVSADTCPEVPPAFSGHLALDEQQSSYSGPGP
ncbi:hypothetical protein [Streptomyces phaeoluteigriseus]